MSQPDIDNNRRTQMLSLDVEKNRAPESMTKVPSVSYRQLFRYATAYDYLLMFVGTIAATTYGVALPILCFLMGNIIGSFDKGHTPDQMIDSAGALALDFVYAGLGLWVASYGAFACWMTTGERQAIEFRKQYFKALLAQEISWYDKLNPSELATRVSCQCRDIQDAIGEKCAGLAYSLSMVIGALAMGFFKCWQLALVMCTTIPVMAVASTMFVVSVKKMAEISNKAYVESGAIAEQALNAIRTVQALGGEEAEVQAYKRSLDATKKSIVKFGIFSGFSMGFMFFTMGAMYALGFYFGSWLVAQQTWNAIADRHTIWLIL